MVVVVGWAVAGASSMLAADTRKEGPAQPENLNETATTKPSAMQVQAEGKLLHLHNADAVVESVLSGNRDLLAARWSLERAQGRVEQAGRWSNPELGLSMYTDRWLGESEEQGWGGSLSQRFPITDRLRLEKQVSYAELGKAEAEIAAESLRVTMEAVEVWRDLQAIIARLALMEEQEKIYAKLRQYVEQAIDMGAKSVLELDQVNIEQMALRVQRRQLELRRQQSLAVLRRLMGVDSEVEIHVDGEIALLQSRLSEHSMKDGKPVVSPRHPILLQAQAEQDKAEREVALARAQRWEDITVSLEYEQERKREYSLERQTNRFVGLAVSIPLPLWNLRHGELREQLGASRQAQARLDAEQYRLNAEAEHWQQEVEKRSAIVFDLEQGLLQTVRESVGRLEEAWLRGEVDLPDLLRARERLIKFEEEHLQALMEWTRAHDHLQAILLQSPFDRVVNLR